MDLTLDLKSIIAIIAICVAILIAYFSNFWRNRKSISYEIVSNTPLLSSNESIRDRIQILYDNLPVKNVHLVILKITNDGKQPITKTDFIKPLTFTLSAQSQILSFEALILKPKNLDLELNFSENILFLQTNLLNSNDSITLKVIVSSYDFNISADARIVGVKEINKVNSNIRSAKLSYTFLICLFLFGSIFSLLSLSFPLNVSIFVVGLVCIVIQFRELKRFIKQFSEKEEGNIN